MNAYLTVLSARFRTQLQYRAAAWAGFGTQTFFGLVRVMVFSGFFASSTREQPLSFEQVISYIWLGQALFAMIPFRQDSETTTMIRSGNIAYELVRPVKLYWFWFARQLAGRSAPVMLRAIPMALVAAFLFPLLGAEDWALHPPVSIAAFFLFLVSILAAMLLACMLSMLMSISLFWTISGEGISQLVPVLAFLLCGIIIPIPFFPDWMQPILRILPFRGLMDVPFQVYIGKLPVYAALGEIVIQCLWISALGVFSHYLLRRGLRRVVVQGG